jgi:beta-lactam-binding protein with PASTA domain
MSLTKITVVGVASVACAALAAGCGGTKRDVAPSVSVPYLIGKDTLSALALLDQRGLRWRWEEGVGPGVANGFIADTVEGQSPPNGRRVKSGTVVLLSPGSAKVFFRPNPVLNPYGWQP